MKLLILTQYYPPETGAAQNRLHDLAKRLKAKGAEVSILTAMPNYPKMKVFDGYRHSCYKKEIIEGITIRRSWIYVKNSRSIFHRLLNYFSFVFTSLFTGLFRTPRPDYILCESPPLFLGISAFILSRVKGARLIFNISDLWPESAEKLGLIRSRFLLGMSSKLEMFLYRKSYLITGQTKGIVANISQRMPGKTVHWLPNGAEPDVYDPAKFNNMLWRCENGFDPDDFLVFYGGILGHAQGLEVILLAAELLKSHEKIKFVIMGSGPCREELIEMKNKMGINNVVFFDSSPKAKMPEVLASVDVSLIPLRKLDLFKGAIPSKIFESLAMKKPIILGVEGEARSLFIEDARCGVAYTPDDYADLAQKVLLLSGDGEKLLALGAAGREYVKLNFDRKMIADDFYGILSGMVS
ncbi:MAG: glycosyltransferase family 4 protein [Bacteroidales bacterium]|nr:glycosyltransferase family 4 protein [Bacteroidales bacterium]